VKLTVYFNGQFWLGIIERHTEQGLMVARHVFGAEPKDEEILQFISHLMTDLLASQTVGVACEERVRDCTNPKRLARRADLIVIRG